MAYAIVDATSDKEILSSDIVKDGKVTFSMPASDLLLVFKEEQEAPATEEQAPETEEVTEAVTEIQTETTTEKTSEEELTENQTEAKEEGTEAPETEIAETEEAEEATEEETVPETAESEKGITTVMALKVLLGDTSFDPATDYTNIDLNTEDFDIAYKSGNVDVNTIGSYETFYTVTNKATGETGEVLRPVEVVESMTEEAEHSIYVSGDDFVTLHFDSENYKEGEKVTFQATADNGFSILDASVKKCEATEDSINLGDDVEVEKENAVSIEDEEAKALSTYSEKTEDVDLEAEAAFEDSGDVTATYSFTMPDSDVAVMVSSAGTPVTLADGDDDETDPAPDTFKLYNGRHYGQDGTLKHKGAAQLPSSLGNGGAATQWRTVKWIDNGKTVCRIAYCLQGLYGSPGNHTYEKDKAKEISDGSSVAKGLYYLFGGPAWGKNISYTDSNGKEHTVNLKTEIDKYCSTDSQRYALSHYVLSYMYNSSSWNGNDGTTGVVNSTGTALVKKLAGIIKQMDKPTARMSSASLSVAKAKWNTKRESAGIHYIAPDDNIAKVAITQDWLTLVDQTTGKSYTKGQTAVLNGGDWFYFVVDTNQAAHADFTFNCTYAIDFTAYKLVYGGKVQDVGFSYYSGDKILSLSLDVEEQQPDEGELRVFKRDKDLGSTPNGTDYSLEGAVYKVYNANNQEVGTLTTGADGYSNTIKLEVGNYTIKETAASKGYLVDTQSYNVTVQASQTTTQTVLEEPERGQISIHKKLEDAEPDAIKKTVDLTQIGFTLTYLDNSNVKPTKEYHPDANGNLTVTGLYYGNWKLEETTAPKYHEKMEDMTFTLSKDTPVQNTDFTVVNYRYQQDIRLMKKDSISGNVVSLGNTTFQILDETGTPISLVVKGTNKATDTFTTDDYGYVLYDQKIPGGKYTLVELEAPKGYQLADPVVFEITSSQGIATITMNDTPVSAQIHVKKMDKVSKNHAGAGFKFAVIADENILDGSGRTYKGYEKGATLETITTGEDGIATSSVSLYPGKYHIEEVETAANYHLNTDKVSFEVETVQKDGKWTAQVKGNDTATFNVEDEPVMRPIQVLKTDADSGNIAGDSFTFTITAKNVVDGSGAEREGFKSGTVVDTITTDGRGIATSKNLYIGTYIVKETVRKQNYVLSTKEYEVKVTDNKTSDPVKTDISDNPVKKKISVTKIDAETGNHCGAGFKFEIVAVGNCTDAAGKEYKGYEAGSVIETIVTDENGVATSSPLYMGDYTIQEVAVPDGATVSINETKYPFSLRDSKDKDGKLEDIKDTDEPMVVPMDDIADTPTTLQLKKTDAIQKDEDGNPKNLAGITFRVKPENAEDSDDQLYVTDADGMIRVSHLTNNTTYEIREEKTIPGYNLAEEFNSSDERFFTVDEKGLINGSSLYEITITNVPNVVEISKTDITNGKEISGAHLKLTDMDGNIIEEWVSTEESHIIYGLADGQYRLIESIAPDKYEIASSVTQGTMPEDVEEKKNVEGLNSEGIFTVKDSLVVQKVTMKDSPYRWVDISKKELTGDDELPGCTLTIRDAQGNVVDTWVSGTESHKVQLHSGSYTLTEENPAAGYVTAETINFEVIQTSDTDYNVMPVVMKDDVTKVTVSKKDITNGNEIPGAHLIIKNDKDGIVEEWDSTTETHYIEKLPIGSYTLTEITAPNGYEVAETISFTVKDTGEIQHVEMFDSPYRTVEISKTDITNDEELPGAHLEIRDKDNNLVEEWVSTEESHKVDLPHGKYTLTERKPADGYVTAETISFEVLQRTEEGDVEVQHVKMEDDITKVEISKQDVTTKKELPGAKLQIKDSDGKVVEEWTSTNATHYIERLPIGKYTLTEITAPNGYEVAETVAFEVLDTGEIQHVVMYDSPVVNTPKTGDVNPWIPAAAIILVLVLAGAGVVLVKGRKKGKKEE